MGVNLTPIIEKKVVNLEALQGRSIAVDAFNVLHQFLALIRSRDGKPLSDKEGRITSHLVGLAFRATRLISDYRMNLIYVFDGEPPKLKQREVETRRAQRIKAEAEYQEAIKAGDLSTAFSKAVQTGRLTNSMVNDAKRLLDLLGIPWIQAPEEGEAQAAHITAKGDVWASNSRDYDSLLFGTPRLVRYLTIQGQEWLPSQGRARKLEPELIELEIFLRKNAINREQLVDMSILIGTDFNQGLKGIGPKTALKLIKQYNKLENLPADIYSKLPEIYPEIRRIYLKPKVTNDYNIQRREIDRTGLYEFLCNNRDFSRKRVEIMVKRIEQMQMQRSLDNWFKENR